CRLQHQVETVGGMKPPPIPCSQNAHDQNAVVRRAQWDRHGCHSRGGKYERAWRDHLDICWSLDARRRRPIRPPLLKERGRRKRGIHDQDVLVERAQEEINKPPSLKRERASDAHRTVTL